MPSAAAQQAFDPVVLFELLTTAPELLHMPGTVVPDTTECAPAVFRPAVPNHFTPALQSGLVTSSQSAATTVNSFLPVEFYDTIVTLHVYAHGDDAPGAPKACLALKYMLPVACLLCIADTKRLLDNKTCWHSAVSSHVMSNPMLI